MASIQFFSFFFFLSLSFCRIKLQGFSKFGNTTEALGAATALVEGILSKGQLFFPFFSKYFSKYFSNIFLIFFLDLKKFLQQEIVDKNLKEQLAVADSKLGGIIKEKLGIACVNDNGVHELMRGIRTQLNNLITGLPETELKAMILGLSHSLSRYKLKFSPEKVDVMIIQAICEFPLPSPPPREHQPPIPILSFFSRSG